MHLPAASPACARHRRLTPHQAARTAPPAPGLPVSVSASPSRLTVHGGRGVSSSSPRPLLSRLPAVLLQAPQPLWTAAALLPTAPLTSLPSVLSLRGLFHHRCCLKPWNGFLLWGEGGHRVPSPPLSPCSPACSGLAAPCGLICLLLSTWPSQTGLSTLPQTRHVPSKLRSRALE